MWRLCRRMEKNLFRPVLFRNNQLSVLPNSLCALNESSVVTCSCTYLMRSCTVLSAPCSCLTVVAAEATWTEAGTGAVTGGDGPAVTAVPVPGSVFTASSGEKNINFNSNSPTMILFWTEKIQWWEDGTEVFIQYQPGQSVTPGTERLY